MSAGGSVNRTARAIALATLELKLYVFVQALERRYAPDQPRIPAGNLDGGQWTNGGAASGNRRVVATTPTVHRVAQGWTLFGKLAQQIIVPTTSVALCVYDFGDGGLWVLQSDNKLGCMPMVHESVVIPAAGGRGTRLNDY